MAQTARKTAASGKSASAADRAERKPARSSKSDPEPTHRVIRPIVIGGEPRVAGDLVYLDGVDAAELESHGYVRKV